ncbi:MAG: FHA domain-containing protein [Planctomycetes bacterium]|nr:FHA domain-containing protein [Planctomycetota bacterium]
MPEPETAPPAPSGSRKDVRTEAITRVVADDVEAVELRQPKLVTSGRAMLYWREGTNPGTTYVLMAGRMATVGRDPCCSVSIFDKSLSRQHSVFKAEADGTWSVFDPGSANGTFVNGQKVRQTRLKHGDRLTLGRITIIFRQGDAGDPAVATLENPRLAVRKKLVTLSEKPDFLAQNLEHRLRPWMRDLKVMLTEEISADGEKLDAFTIGRLMLEENPALPLQRIRVHFMDHPAPVDLSPSQAALYIPEIDAIQYLAGKLGKGGVPLDAYTWGERRVVVTSDHWASGHQLSMGQVGKLDILAAGSGEHDLAKVLPVRFSGLDPVVPVEFTRLARIVDEFDKIE